VTSGEPAIPTTMWAMALTAFGGPENLQRAALPVPVPEPHEVLIGVRTVAANRQDTYTMRPNAARGPARLPHVLGIDPAGVVVAVGEAVRGFERGERVVVKPSISCSRCRFCLAGEDDACENLRTVGVHRWGGMAEYVAVPMRNVFRIPDNISFAEATANSHSFPVALTMLRERARITAQDVVLVTSAAGAVASAAVQLARQHGARVIAAAGGAERVERARTMGANEVVDYHALPAFAEAVRQLAPDGVSLYVETAGAPTVWREALKTLGRRARVTVCGSHGGPVVELDLNWLFRTRVSVIGCSGSSLAAYRDVLELARAGRIQSNIHALMPLERAREAFEILLGHENRGKIVLEVADSGER
jgi:NADPH:quinone reductase-like Zn-dependent oxidoreductase